MQQNPKANPTDNAEKDPQDWVTGDEPVTGAQAWYLDDSLTKAEASEKVEEMKALLGK